MQRPTSPYQVLNVSPDAEPEVIDAAYKALMKKYHPDRAAGGAPLSESKAADINNAFRILRDPERRARHDADERSWRPVVTGPDRGPNGARSAAQEPGAAGRPPPPPYLRPAPLPAQRPRGRRIMGWSGVVAALLLIGFTVANTEGSGGAGAASLRETLLAATGQTPDVKPSSEAALNSTPVSKRRVAEALVEYERVQALYGPIGVAAYSDACFEAQSRSLNMGEFDFCVAFDHAASALDSPASLPLSAPFAPTRFSEGQLLSRHAGAAKLLPGDYQGLDDRLSNIKTLTREAIAGEGEQAPAVDRPSAASQPRQRQPARTRYARSERRAQPAPRPRGRAADADFLEREGGIY